jgi:hypothetical protein
MRATEDDLASRQDLLDRSGAGPFREALPNICTARCGERTSTFAMAE